jgi:hypothetical protein
MTHSGQLAIAAPWFVPTVLVAAMPLARAQDRSEPKTAENRNRLRQGAWKLPQS